MAKFVVTSNLLLGSTESGRWEGDANSTWDESIRMLETVIEKAHEAKAQAVFVVGNFFDSSRPPAEIVMRASQALSGLPRGVHVYLIDGAREVSGLKHGHVSPTKAFLGSLNKVHVISETKVVDLEGTQILCAPHPRRGESETYEQYYADSENISAVLSAAPIDVMEDETEHAARDKSFDHSSWVDEHVFGASDTTFFATGNGVISQLPSIGSPYPLNESDARYTHCAFLVDAEPGSAPDVEEIETGHRSIATVNAKTNEDAADLFDWAMDDGANAPDIVSVNVPLAGPSAEVYDAVEVLKSAGVDVKLKRVFPEEAPEPTAIASDVSDNASAAEAFLEMAYPDDQARQSRVMSVIKRAMSGQV